jgi:NADPH:quinone reductase-like Zn-dependent oxidoreductase
MMRAYEIGPAFGLDQLRLIERPIPEPGPFDIIVRMHAVALNFRDLLVIEGVYHPKLALPRIVGSDGVGQVVAVGSAVRRVRVGDRVAGTLLQGWSDGPLTAEAARTGLGGNLDGVLCDYAVFAEDGVVPVPDHLSDDEAATLPCAGVTAWSAICDAPNGLSNVKPGESVLVLGTGGVSLFALQFAKLSGARVIVTSKSDAKLARVKSLGASETINYLTTPDWDRAVRDLTGGVGVDHVVEVGGAGTLPLSVRAVRHGGRIALIGVLASASAGEFNPLPAMMKGVTIQGVFLGSRAAFQRMNAAISVHRLRPVVDRVFPFEAVPEALALLKAGGHFGKLVVRVTGAKP